MFVCLYFVLFVSPYELQLIHKFRAEIKLVISVIEPTVRMLLTNELQQQQKLIKFTTKKALEDMYIII